MAEPNWGLRAAVAILAITGLRVLALALDGTDLFVDEAQYWLWGQNLDWGYYSKPPLIGWVIRAVTEIAGSDGRFWIRLAAPLFHAAAAGVLYFVGRRLAGGAAGFWTAVAYLSLPILAVGSWQISTDTILAPFYAGALLALLALVDRPGGARAALTGALVGLAFMAKYAGIYFLICLGLGALLVPALRIGWRNAALLLLAFAAVIAPNVLWNLANDLTTVSHTMDNADWVNDADPLASLDAAEALRFLGSQVAVFGPVFAVALVVLSLRPRKPAERVLMVFTWLILAMVTVQALLSGAYANWAFPAYLAATPLVVAWLLPRARAVFLAGIALHAVFAAGFAFLYVAPTTVAPGGTPLAARYLGREAFSRAALDFAEEAGAAAIVARSRDILADLHHSGRDAGLEVRALAGPGAPRHYYEQRFAYAPKPGERVIWAGRDLPEPCPVLAERAPPLDGTAYAGRGYRLVLTEGACLALGPPGG